MEKREEWDRDVCNYYFSNKVPKTIKELNLELKKLSRFNGK